MGEGFLLGALQQLRAGEKIDPQGPAMKEMISCVQYFPELNYVCPDYTNEAMCREGILRQLETRGEAFVDELIALQRNKENPARSAKQE